MKGKKNFGRSGIRRVRFLIVSSLVMFLMVLVATFRFSTHAAFVTKTWDGGGSTNNWSEAANWSGDTVPVTGDSVVFDATSTKNATVDINIRLQGLDVNSGYTGTVSVASGITLTIGVVTGTSNSSLSAGTLSCGSGGTIFFDVATFTQSGGTFNCQNGTFNSNTINLVLNGGTFNAPAGTMTLGAQFGGNFTKSASATFNHDNGTIILNGGEFVWTNNGGVLDVNNLTDNLTSRISVLNNRVRVLGTLTLNDGDVEVLGIEAQENVTFGSGFGSGNSSNTGIGPLQITGNAARTVTLPTLTNSNLLYSPIVLDAPNVTLTTSGSGPVKMLPITLVSGTVSPGTNFSIIGSSGLTVPSMSGGTLNCGTQTVFFDNVNFTQSGGTFNCQNGTFDSGTINLILNGGTFNAPTGAMTLGGQFGGSFRKVAAATFNHDNGTVLIGGNEFTFFIQNNAASTVDFNNLIVNMVGNVGSDGNPNDRLRINGDLTWTHGNDGIAIIEALGNITIGDAGLSSSLNLIFSGTRQQTFTNTGGPNPSGLWTINKPFGRVTVASNLLLHDFSRLDVVSGILYLGPGANLTTPTATGGATTVGPNGKILADSNNVITLGDNVVNNGTINLHSNGTGCPTADSIQLRSSVAGTQRSWSGNGVFRAINVDVKDMGGSAAVKVFNGANSGNNGGNWTFDSSCLANFIHTPFDFDGDRKTDFSIYRPSNNIWFLMRSTLGLNGAQWGIATDKLAPADFDGDGITDVAVWREATRSTFFILQSSSDTVRIEDFGITGDDPALAGDWDGDGKADPAVYRNAAAGGQSFIFFRGSLNNPNGNITFIPWGIGGDVPVRGDFDGDGKMDAAVFRPSDGNWYIMKSSNLQLMVQQWGLATDKRIEGDFDADGKTDFAVFRPSDTFWYVLQSSNGQPDIRRWGLSTDIPLQGDYDGDGKADLAVWRPTDGSFWIARSGGGTTVLQFGLSGDVPPASVFVR